MVNQFLQFPGQAAVGLEVIPQQFQGGLDHQGSKPDVLRGGCQGSAQCLHGCSTVTILQEKFTLAGQCPGVIRIGREFLVHVLSQQVELEEGLQCSRSLGEDLAFVADQVAQRLLGGNRLDQFATACINLEQPGAGGGKVVMTVAVEPPTTGHLPLQVKRVGPGRLPIGQGDRGDVVLVDQYGRLLVDAGDVESLAALLGFPARNPGEQVKTDQVLPLDRGNKNRVTRNRDRCIQPARLARHAGSRAWSANDTLASSTVKRVAVTPFERAAGDVNGHHGACGGWTDQYTVRKGRAGSGKATQTIHQDRAGFHVGQLLGPL